MPHDPYKALYIHIPFCVSRCNYCDFYTNAVARDSSEITEAIENDIMEIRRLGREGELSQIETIYIGGGTPSFVGTKHLTNLLYTLGLTLDMQGIRECSIEANPESIDARLINDIWALGANRLSIGVQSFDDEVLKTLGRAHDRAQAIDAIRMASERFDNISIDLMCGVPAQDIKSFEADLDVALSFPIKHVSIYPLTIEPATPFAKLLDKGRLDLPSEDEQADMMELAQRRLVKAGFSRYEVASYSKPGYESAHNSMYWTAAPYLGIGRSATTMTQNAERRMRVQDGRVVDDLDAAQMAAEDVMLGLRMSKGVSDELIVRASALLPRLDGVLADLADKGLVEHIDQRWQPTERGWICGNELYGAILETAPF